MNKRQDILFILLLGGYAFFIWMRDKASLSG
jgi:heme exporter protein D